jgi:hypothetical protein
MTFPRLQSEIDLQIFRRFSLLLFKSKTCHVCPIVEQELPSIDTGALPIAFIDVDEVNSHVVLWSVLSIVDNKYVQKQLFSVKILH